MANGIDMSINDEPLPLQFSWRLLMCFTTALVVTATAWIVAWRECRNWEFAAYSPQSSTWRSLKRVSASVERYRQKAGKLPGDLTELDIVKDEEATVNNKGQPVDSWGNPFGYQVNGENYVVISYGRDGQPGGEGYDADFRSDQDPTFVKMTLWEFTSESRTMGMKLACILGGLFAFPICLFLRPPRRSQGTIIKVLAMNIITAVFAIIVAVLMSVLHLPTGH
jgi:Type II secretion system (T2SS), protein G